jgi:hypothetical protein
MVKIMKAKINLKNQKSEAKGSYRDKEIVSSYHAIVVKNNKPIEIIKCQVYMGRSSQSSTVYANIWIHSREKNYYVSGYGNAGGYGYCKESTAIAEAIERTGIKLSKGIGGVGESAIREALTAIVRALGYKGQIIIV